MKVLAVTSEPITAGQLRDALGTDKDLSDTEVMVVAPAFADSGFKFWMSDADEAIARAEEVRVQSVERLGQEGVSATGDTGEADPYVAIEDALKTFGADRIVLFTHGGDAQRYREDLDEREIGERFGLPVNHTSV
ncbi:MAG TPA: hypothetical protein VLC49_14555 [Solirubrobacteraceae bacterium]|nr:hypothetical protein [Solirubrobacteraceae bacterium]